MSDDMIRQLERGYTMMWREGRADEAVSVLGADFEWVVPDHPEGAVRHGAEGVLEFSTIEMSGRGRDSGLPTGMTFWQVWTYRGGRAVRMQLYWDEDEARRGAGLE